jgi:hypothetical protein
MMIKYLKIIRHIYIYKDDSLRVIETYYLHMQGVYVDKDTDPRKFLRIAWLPGPARHLAYPRNGAGA